MAAEFAMDDEALMAAACGEDAGGDGEREGPEPAVPESIPARMLNEFTYCPRLGYLMWVEREWAHSADTLDGIWQHRRVDRPGGTLPETGAEAETEAEQLHARSVELSSARLGLVAKLDLVEAEGRVATPVDYKRGAKPDVPSGVWEPERIQLGAQALLLEEQGYVCEKAIIYYVASRQRVEIRVDAELRRRTLEQLAAFREVAAAGVIPPPLDDSPKCPRCSLVGICLPDEVRLLRDGEAEAARLGGDGDDGLDEDFAAQGPEPAEEPKVRRLLAARDDALPLHVQEPGAYVGKTGDCLKVSLARQVMCEPRILHTSQVCLFGNAQMTTQALQACLREGVPVSWFSGGGYFLGMTQGMQHRNVELRRQQFAAAADPQRCLSLARSFVASKLRNQRTLLRRNAEGLPDEALLRLKEAARKARRAPDLPTLLGIEGSGARLYFEHFGKMLKGSAQGAGDRFDFEGRNRRPPKDPINALLSFGYALLSKDWSVTLQSVGFDPLMGFYHQPRYGRPALALDLMEEFRPLIVDSVVLSVLNNRVLLPHDFVSLAGACSLEPSGKKSFLLAYERRMDELVTHPVFGYRLSYRRVLELQARLLARTLSGELRAYPPFGTR